MDELISMLNKMQDAYFEFVDSVADYAESKPGHLEVVLGYLKNNKNVTTSDVVKFISSQPDFFDDCVDSEDVAV